VTQAAVSAPCGVSGRRQHAWCLDTTASPSTLTAHCPIQQCRQWQQSRRRWAVAVIAEHTRSKPCTHHCAAMHADIPKQCNNCRSSRRDSPCNLMSQVLDSTHAIVAQQNDSIQAGVNACIRVHTWVRSVLAPCRTGVLLQGKQRHSAHAKHVCGIHHTKVVAIVQHMPPHTPTKAKKNPNCVPYTQAPSQPQPEPKTNPYHPIKQVLYKQNHIAVGFSSMRPSMAAAPAARCRHAPSCLRRALQQCHRPTGMQKAIGYERNNCTKKGFCATSVHQRVPTPQPQHWWYTSSPSLVVHMQK
jgi:hypothetical protein